MPTSQLYHLTPITEMIALTEPESVLDVGVGFGKYGVLAREYLEFWDEREAYRDWKRRIDGIEAFPEYLTPVHEYVYDEIYTGDALEVVPRLDAEYDLILLIDVLEHFDYSDGLKLLAMCQKCGRNLIISTPRDIGEQEDAFGNPYEAHRFQWKRKHFRPLGNHFFAASPQSLLCYAGEQAAQVRRARWAMRYKLRSRRVRHFFRRLGRRVTGELSQ